MINTDSTKGMTLLELIVALALSSIVISLCAMMYLKSTGQFHRRVHDSRLLQTWHLVNTHVDNSLKKKIDKCAFGRVYYFSDSGVVDIKEELIERFPGLETINFRCYELDRFTGNLVTWGMKENPDLIEYMGNLKGDVVNRRISGSIMR
jgi:prepilin-type N-terminal cleavage/methylation domain-containing protein